MYRGLMGWLCEVTSALSENNRGLYQLRCTQTCFGANVLERVQFLWRPK